MILFYINLAGCPILGVHYRHNGEEAITLAQQAAHDILFIDLKLPTINGLETYVAIREINRQAVAIMITAYRQEMADLYDPEVVDACLKLFTEDRFEFE